MDNSLEIKNGKLSMEPRKLAIHYSIHLVSEVQRGIDPQELHKGVTW